MTPRFVLDAWAILALLQGKEPAASRVRQLLEEAQEDDAELLLSVINLGEVAYRIGRVKGEAEARGTVDQLRALPLTVLPATDEAVFAAARLKMRYAISYADAFAAAAADEWDAVLVTGDPELEQLQGRIRIEKLERGGRA
jgi:predicted nucleic acid-binding protein